jgi:hypothetical protein
LRQMQQPLEREALILCEMHPVKETPQMPMAVCMKRIALPSAVRVLCRPIW